MKKPEPSVGLVVRYDYLWHNEAMKGREEGTKERPCAVVLAVQGTETNKPTVFLAPITHSPPSPHERAVEIDYKVAKHLGLDDQKQWLKTMEVNKVSWDDAGIVPAKEKQWEYGRLPKGLVDRYQKEFKQNAQEQKVKLIKRQVDEEHKRKRETQERGKNQGRGRSR